MINCKWCVSGCGINHGRSIIQGFDCRNSGDYQISQYSGSRPRYEPGTEDNEALSVRHWTTNFHLRAHKRVSQIYVEIINNFYSLLNKFVLIKIATFTVLQQSILRLSRLSMLIKTSHHLISTTD